MYFRVVLGRDTIDSEIPIVGVLICWVDYIYHFNRNYFFVLNHLFAIFRLHLILFYSVHSFALQGSSTVRHGWYDIVCGVAIARRPRLVLVDSHVANIALDQSESYPLTRRSGHEREHHQ